MPNPRTSITWTTQNYDTLRRLAALGDQTLTSIVNELIAAVEPELRRAADLADQSKAASEEAKQAMARAAEQADALLMPQLKGAYRSYQEAIAQLEEAASGQEPPSSNTGVVK